MSIQAVVTTIKDNLPFLTALAIPVLSYLTYKIYPFIEPFFYSTQRTDRNGGELVAAVLKSHGVKWIFTLVGGHISPILVEAKKHGIRVIDVRSECTTVFAADAVSRLSGIPGVAVVTAGPGVTNTITAMKNAQMAQSPLVLIGGAAVTLLKGRGSLQDVEQLDVLRSIVKYSYAITSLREIVPQLKKAFYFCQTGVPGPVFIEIPIDCLYNIGEVSAGMGLGLCLKKKELLLNDENEKYKNQIIVPYEFNQKNNLNFDKNVINNYLKSIKNENHPIYVDICAKKYPFFVDKYVKYQRKYLYSGAFTIKYDYKPIKIKQLLPTNNDINNIINLLLNSKKPTIIISSQTLLNGQKKYEIQKAVETLSIPTFLSSMARGLLGRNHRLYIKQGRTAAIRQSDLIILLGTMVDFRLDYGRSFNKNGKIITINRCYNDLKLNSDLFWRPFLKLQCDPGETILKISNFILNKYNLKYKKKINNVFNSWCSSLKKIEIEKEKENISKSLTKSYLRPALNMKKNVSCVLNPIYLCLQIEKYMDDNSIMIVDGGDFAATAAYICRPRGPLKWLDPGPFGTLGVGAGFVLGAKLVNPTSEIWLIWGDGSSGYSLAEIDTFKRFGIGVICVIGNDACWSQIEREQIPKLGDNTACMLSYCDYHIVSKGFGGDGEEIWDKKQLNNDKNGLNPFLRAKEYVKKNNSPYVINAHIGTSNFREGSISV